MGVQGALEIQDVVGPGMVGVQWVVGKRGWWGSRVLGCTGWLGSKECWGAQGGGV